MSKATGLAGELQTQVCLAAQPAFQCYSQQAGLSVGITPEFMLELNPQCSDGQAGPLGDDEVVRALPL